ncbi:hypothetical protein BDZ89DRAFT_1040715 [Hymenopellis radicata]|nr:hypothetical protein BDZ89DRAFT_1040715 [Hymenopellis radicata]
MAQAATGSTAIQLLDLPSCVRAFGLRTNSRCKWASDTSIEHLSSVALIDRELLGAVKGGLLASLCFPTCDGSQLRAAADFMTIWMIQYARHARGDFTEWVPYRDLENLESLRSDRLFQYGVYVILDMVELVEGPNILEHTDQSSLQHHRFPVG